MSVSTDSQITLKRIHQFFLMGFSLILLLLGIFLIDTPANEGLFTENKILYAVFNIITEAGSEYFYIVFFAFMYIAWDKDFTRQIMINFSIVTHFNTVFKLIFQDPRPATNIIDGEPRETSFGFPSGHTSGTTSVWSLVFLKMDHEENVKQRYIVQGIAILLLILVPLSRLIIGVHDLEDVIGGFLLAIMLTVLFIILEPKLKKMVSSWQKQILIYSISALLLWIISVLFLTLIHPDAWIAQAENIAQTSGMLLGLAIGIPLEKEFVQYQPNKYPPKYRVFAGIGAILLTFLMYFGLSFLLKLLQNQFIFRGVRYCLLTGLLALGLPWLVKIVYKKMNISIQ